jgi:transcriptional regulator with XRE-family HTH domain
MADIVTDRRVGHALRLIRGTSRLTQAQVAVASGMSQSAVSRLECGHAGGLTLNAIRAVAAALDARVDVKLLWRGAEFEKLLDERHAHLSGKVVRAVSGWGWLTEIEISFSVYGERGSIDILAWHEASRSLLVIEIKTLLASIEELVRRLDMKHRLAAGIAHARFGWRPATVSRLVVLPGDRSVYRAVDRHDALLSSAFPARGADVRSWLRQPEGRLSGLWLLSSMHGTGRSRNLPHRGAASGARSRR